MTTTVDGRVIEVSRDQAGRRYRAAVEGEVIAEAEFLLTPDLIVFTHTAVDPAFEGQGVGSTLIRWALGDARADGYAVVPSCPFVQAYVRRHADEYADILHRSTSGSTG